MDHKKYWHFILFLTLLACTTSKIEGASSSTNKSESIPPVSQTPLILKTHHKLQDLLGTDEKLEASGVVKVGAFYYVVFDNFSKIAKISTKLEKGKTKFSWLNENGDKHGFEAIAYDKEHKTFYAVVEALERNGKYQPKIYEFNNTFSSQGNHWVKVKFDGDGKGLEGLEHIQRGGQDYLLGLCEGNFCEGGDKGKQGGGGRIRVLEKSGKHWIKVATIKLPKSLNFEDYASISLAGNRMAIVSQKDSELWVGHLKANEWAVKGKGQKYAFPKEGGKKIFGNVEGVCWLGESTLVAVSDKKKKKQGKRYKARDQSLHIFEIP